MFKMLDFDLRQVIESVPSFYDQDAKDIKAKFSKAIIALSFLIDEAAWKRAAIQSHEFGQKLEQAKKDYQEHYESMMVKMSSWAEMKLAWTSEIAKKYEQIQAEKKKRGMPASSSSSMPKMVKPEGEDEKTAMVLEI